MKMFSSLSPDADSLDSRPALASAISKPDFPEKYYAVDNADTYSLLDEMYEDGVAVEDLMETED
ncbi:MAG: hypothetical protein J6Y87_04485, partial [Muribaculaceae bacterium]|nr:hypothetical protein [Muribaculaceae bacterium]